MTDLKSLTILLVEDEELLRRETASFLELYCRRVIPAAHGREAMVSVRRESPDLVVSDIRMPFMDGLELAALLKKEYPDIPLLLCTAFTETSYLLKAIELGVSAFIRKPVDGDELLAAIARAAVSVVQRREIRGLNDELAAALLLPLGDDPYLRPLVEQVTQVARTSFNVLLQGETGTGKTRLAGIIHNLSPRRVGPFVTAQLNALPLHLVESELFGSLGGAAPGGDPPRQGLVEAAHGGTLFLDDIDACPPDVQTKLLRFAAEKTFRPLGGGRDRFVDVRLVSAGNRNLMEEVRGGRFREDFYYRLADVALHLPPLRETVDAIVPLALNFLRESCHELGRDVPRLTGEARDVFSAMTWPGNIRQLKSVIRRCALAAGQGITDATLREISSDELPTFSPVCATGAPAPPPFPCTLNSLEKWSLEQALRHCGGKLMKTAAMLEMNYYTFRRRLERHGISVGDE